MRAQRDDFLQILQPSLPRRLVSPKSDAGGSTAKAGAFALRGLPRGSALRGHVQDGVAPVAVTRGAAHRAGLHGVGRARCEVRQHHPPALGGIHRWQPRVAGSVGADAHLIGMRVGHRLQTHRQLRRHFVGNPNGIPSFSPRLCRRRYLG